MLVKSLDKASFIPLYFQIQQDLAHKIDSGALKEGEALPGRNHTLSIAAWRKVPNAAGVDVDCAVILGVLSYDL